jgi:hypothetical protein
MWGTDTVLFRISNRLAFDSLSISTITITRNNLHDIIILYRASNNNEQTKQASPEGQKIFDKLLKACNDVSWDGESIIVLGEIRVDPPYTSNECVLMRLGKKKGGGGGGGLDGSSLERVKNIVNAAVAVSSSK